MGIETIKLVKCKAENVDAALGTLNLSANGSIKARVSRLADYYKANETTVDLATCDVCGGESDASLEACPFCGDEGAVVEPETTEAIDATEPEDEDRGEPREEPEPGEDDPDGATAEGGDTDAIDTQGDDMATTKATKGKKGKAAPAPKKATAPKGKAAKATPTTALAPKGKGKAAKPTPEGSSLIVHSSEDLDAKVAEIKEAVTGGAVAMHRLGMAANEIVKGALWKQRVGDDGVPTFRNFKQFCQAELKMTAQHIYRAMAVAAEFKETEIVALSGKQVRLVLEVPKEHRGEVMEAAGKGESTAALTDRANALRGGRKPLPEPTRAITVAVAPGHTKIKMYAKPNTGGAKALDIETAKRAKKLAESPWGYVDLTNKVRMILRVSLSPQGEVIADVEFRRGEPTL